MIKATIEDKALVTEILCASFDDNLSVNYIVRQDDRRRLRVRRLMEYSFFSCLEFGEVYLSDDRACCALVMFPDRKRFSFAAMFRDLRLLFEVSGLTAVFKLLRRESLIKRRYPSDSLLYYIWFVGTLPGAQGKGMGTLMMNFLLAEASRMKRPVYLETSVLQNVAWYQRMGFSVYDTLELGYLLYFLRKLN